MTDVNRSPGIRVNSPVALRGGPRRSRRDVTVGLATIATIAVGLIASSASVGSVDGVAAGAVSAARAAADGSIARVSAAGASTDAVIDGASAAGASTDERTYVVVDTGQGACYDAGAKIPCPSATEAFFGQDGNYAGVQPAYADNGDGTVTDLNTGLMWQKSPGEKVTFAQAVAGAPALALAGHRDWRLPSIKELYSLIDFRGVDPSGWSGTDTSLLEPFIDTNYFDFEYGDVAGGERIIDAQCWSATEYVGTTMNGDATVFGVNFADGRIKGYPRDRGPGGSTMTEFVRYVRGNAAYGVNDLVDNGDGTITDQATGLMWSRADSGTAYDWRGALEYAEEAVLAGHDDWRLPNAKELQSIVDYTRSPSTSGSAAIAPVFLSTGITDEAGDPNFGTYWSGTTHINMSREPGSAAAYVAFGEALGFMEVPPGSGNRRLMDVHGAGAQRSDPKAGDPGEWPYGHGPQGDVVRIYNLVRVVRDAEITPPATDTPATVPATDTPDTPVPTDTPEVSATAATPGTPPPTLTTLATATAASVATATPTSSAAPTATAPGTPSASHTEIYFPRVARAPRPGG